MKKAKFLQEAKLDPARFYRNPSDVMRDRRLTDDDRREIIAAWERNTLDQGRDGLPDTQQLDRLRELRKQLEGDFTISESPGLGSTSGAGI